MSRAFRNLKADEVLNFSVAVTVMRVQRKWRARMRAAKMKRKKEVGVFACVAGGERTLRASPPAFSAGRTQYQLVQAYKALCVRRHVGHQCGHQHVCHCCWLCALLSVCLPQFRADRGVAPLYSDIVAARDSTMKEALRRRQVCVAGGGCRWRLSMVLTGPVGCAEAM